jgi:hypothetical protein
MIDLLGLRPLDLFLIGGIVFAILLDALTWKRVSNIARYVFRK